MKRALLVEQTADGGFRLPWDTHDRPLADIEAEADSVKKVSDLTGWGEWTELYSVECGGVDTLYFVRETNLSGEVLEGETRL